MMKTASDTVFLLDLLRFVILLKVACCHYLVDCGLPGGLTRV